MPQAFNFENWSRDDLEQDSQSQGLILIDHLSGQLYRKRLTGGGIYNITYNHYIHE